MKQKLGFEGVVKHKLNTTIGVVLLLGWAAWWQLSTPAKENPQSPSRAEIKRLEERLRGADQQGAKFMDKILSSAPVARADENDFVGDYSYEMSLPRDGKETGKVVVRKYKSIYYLRWTRDDGPIYRGIGIRRGNTLSVCYSYTLWIQGERGVSMYWITDDKKILGKWTVMGVPTTDVQTDEWKRIK